MTIFSNVKISAVVANSQRKMLLLYDFREIYCKVEIYFVL
jgi:hypothetical protein